MATNPNPGVLTTSSGTSGTVWNTASTNAQVTAKGKLKVEGPEADLIINDKSLSEWMSKIEERLLILQPKPELLEKYQALQTAYEQYKTLEALCVDNNNIINN